MTEPRPFASLTSNLLARKGFARPAMRPQGHGHALTAPGDDLGWNDMGLYDGDLSPPDDLADAPRAPTAAYLTPLPLAETADAPEAPLPVVLQQQAEIAEGLGVVAEGLPSPPAEPARRKVKNGAKTSKAPALPAAPALRGEPGARKAAFTLRLDAERHLRLRLACAINHRSAQKLLIEALDAHLDTVAGLDELVARAAPGGSAV